MDPRGGGTWRQQMVVNDVLQYPTGGTYLEVVPGERLVFRWGASGGWPELAENDEHEAPVVTLSFLDSTGGTHLELTVTFPEQQAADEVHALIEGWSATLDRVVQSSAITAWLREHEPQP